MKDHTTKGTIMPAIISIAVIIVSAYSIHTALRNLGVLK